MPNEQGETDVGRTTRPIRLVRDPEVRRIQRPGATGDERELEPDRPVLNRACG